MQMLVKLKTKWHNQTIGALANLATTKATDRGVVATLTEANSRLAKQLENHSNELKDIKALLKKERAERKGQITFNQYPENYCWTHGYKVANSHTSLSCNYPKHGHKIIWGAAKQTENYVQGQHL
jgi:hypothetical protein